MAQQQPRPRPPYLSPELARILVRMVKAAQAKETR